MLFSKIATWILLAIMSFSPANEAVIRDRMLNDNFEQYEQWIQRGFYDITTWVTYNDDGTVDLVMCSNWGREDDIRISFIVQYRDGSEVTKLFNNPEEAAEFLTDMEIEAAWNYLRT